MISEHFQHSRLLALSFGIPHIPVCPLLSFPLATGQTFPVSYFFLMKLRRVNVLPDLLAMSTSCSFSLSGTSPGLCHGHSGAARRPPEVETQQQLEKGL